MDDWTQSRVLNNLAKVLGVGIDSKMSVKSKN